MNRPIRDFALEVHFSHHEFTARYNLTGSDAETHSVEEVLALGTPQEREAYLRMPLGYTETWGAPALREAIAATYETDAIGAAQVLTFAGAQEALYVATRVLLEPGDHAVVITPNYQSAETLPLSVCEVTGVPLRPELGWQLDVDEFLAALRPNTRLVSINFPNNPTGAILARPTFDGLVAACRERGIWLFSDEVYRLIEADPARRLPQVAEVYERGLSLNVLSKAYGLAGLRIGWLACQDRDLLAEMNRYKHYLSICNSAPSEHLARIALQHREVLLTRNRAIVASNLELLDAFFARHTAWFDWQRPDGSCVAFPRYKGADGVEVFCDRLVRESGVLLLPASIYRSDLTATPDDRFRIGFGKRAMPQALQALEDWMAQRSPAWVS